MNTLLVSRRQHLPAHRLPALTADPDSCDSCAAQANWDDPLCPAHRQLKTKLTQIQRLVEPEQCADCAQQDLVGADDQFCVMHRMQKRLMQLMR